MIDWYWWATLLLAGFLFLRFLQLLFAEVSGRKDYLNATEILWLLGETDQPGKGAS